MNYRDFVQIGVCAAVTALVTVAVVTGQAVMSDGPNPAPRNVAHVAGDEIIATAIPGPKPDTVSVQLQVANPGVLPTSNTFQLAVVKRDFTGSPGARVVMLSDFTKKLVAVQTVSANLAPRRSYADTIVLTKDRLEPTYTTRMGSPNATPQISSWYEVDIVRGSSVSPVAGFSGQLLDSKPLVRTVWQTPRTSSSTVSR